MSPLNAIDGYCPLQRSAEILSSNRHKANLHSVSFAFGRHPYSLPTDSLPSLFPLDSPQKNENRVASDEDLKLSDLLRYYQRDATAVKALLFRRLRCLADYEQANKALEKARAKNKDVHVVSGVVGEVGWC